MSYFRESVVELNNYEDFGGLLFPRSISMTVLGPGGNEEMRATFTVDVLALNQYIAPATFSVVGNHDTYKIFSLDPQQVREDNEAPHHYP